MVALASTFRPVLGVLFYHVSVLGSAADRWACCPSSACWLNGCLMVSLYVWQSLLDSDQLLLGNRFLRGLIIVAGHILPDIFSNFVLEIASCLNDTSMWIVLFTSFGLPLLIGTFYAPCRAVPR